MRKKGRAWVIQHRYLQKTIGEIERLSKEQEICFSKGYFFYKKDAIKPLMAYSTWDSKTRYHFHQFYTNDDFGGVTYNDLGVDLPYSGLSPRDLISEIQSEKSCFYYWKTKDFVKISSLNPKDFPNKWTHKRLDFSKSAFGKKAFESIIKSLDQEIKNLENEKTKYLLALDILCGDKK